MSCTASGYRLKDSDYPAVPEKSGYTGTWTKYTDAIVSDIQVNATYKRTTPVPTVRPTGGVVASLTEEPTEPDVPPVEEELMEDLEPQESPAEQENTQTEPIATQAQVTTTHTVQHDYVTQSGRLVREKVTEDGTLTAVMDFVYDESGCPLALLYSANGTDFTTYYYILNLQGDVVKLIGTDGSIAASYTYDAWGNILSSSGTMANINPLRYRGYYYDSETGYYYLQSRYYDPTTRRFLNADSIVSTGQGFVGINMFAYCNNNPVRYEDSGGTLPTVSINTVRADTGATRPDNYVEPEAMSFYNKNREFIDQRIERYVSENSTVEILYAGSFRITDSNRENGALWNGLSAGALKGIAGAFLFIPSLFPGQKLITEAAVIVIEYLISKYIGRGENKNLPNGYYEHYTIFIDTPCVTYGEPGVKTTIVDMYWAWIDDSSNSVAFVFRVDHF